MAYYAKPSSTLTFTITGFATGLAGTLGYRLLGPAAGVTAIARTTTGITEEPAGSAAYVGTLEVPATQGAYRLGVDSGTVSPTTYAIDELVVSDSVDAYGVPIAIAAGGTVTYAGPVTLTGDVLLVRGDDYNNSDSRALEWTTSSSTEWPTLTGATVTMTVKSASAGTTELTKAGTVVTATGADKKVRVELTAAETALAVGSDHVFDVQATLSGGRKVTLVRGSLSVLQDYTT